MAHKLLKPTISLAERKTTVGWHNRHAQQSGCNTTGNLNEMTSFTSESKLSAVKETADNEPFLRPDIELEIE